MTEAATRRVPITLLTGFLGSGKTTILNSLLRQPAMARTAVIVNEFGEIGIDHLLVARSSEEIVELSSGCVCCTIRSDLVNTLFGLYAHRIDGRLPPFERVLIETTGLAAPAPLLFTLFTDAAVAPRFAVDGVLTVVDAANGEATLDNQPEAFAQAAAADRLLLTKCDIAAPTAVAALTARLRRVNPGCPILEVRNGAVEAGAVIGLGLHEQADPAAAAQRWLSLGGGAHDHEHDALCGLDHRHDRVGSKVIVLDQPVAWPSLLAWIAAVRRIQGPKLLRIKGLAAIAGRPDGPLVVHAVQDVFHPPVFLAGWPSADRRTRLVFLFRDLDPAVIEATVALLREPAATPGEAMA